ncbi:hypothetical protein [Brevundimonas naejangsanensis]|uniref:hypothetical protein n=1 Tax=Brevundimonas naejangsanensis TaxID=588932 RepID=UPI0039F6E50C
MKLVSSGPQALQRDKDWRAKDEPAFLDCIKEVLFQRPLPLLLCYVLHASWYEISKAANSVGNGASLDNVTEPSLGCFIDGQPKVMKESPKLKLLQIYLPPLDCGLTKTDRYRSTDCQRTG